MGDHGGGIARLQAVLRNHRWTLEADLLRWNIDLLDLHRGTLSWRRLLVLYRALPNDSTTRAMENGGVAPMTLAEVIADEIRRDQVAIALNGKGRPDPLPGSPFAPSMAQRTTRAEKERAAYERYQARKAEREAETARRHAARKEDQ